MKEEIIKIYGYILYYGMNIFTTALIFFIGKWLANLISNITGNLMKKAKVDAILSSFTKNLVYFGLLILVIIAALNNLGIQTTSVIAVIAAAGLAIGLALQGALSNFAAGVLIIMFKPFRIGDMIEAGGASGYVNEIQIFNTILTAGGNKRIIIPNAKITADKIIVTQTEQVIMPDISDKAAANTIQTK